MLPIDQSLSFTRSLSRQAVAWSRIPLLILLTLAAAPLAAQSLPDTENDEEDARPVAEVEGEITVSSTLPDLASAFDISGDQVEARGQEDVGEFLRGVAGLEATRRGTINLDPVIRGLQEGQVGVFVDGTRTFAAGPARMDSDLSHVGPHAVQNLRVVKGPYALSWGAGTLAAIRLETFKPSFRTDDGWEWSGSLATSYNDNAESLDSHAGVWGSNDRFRFYLNAGRRTGDDYEAGDGAVVPADYASSEFRWRFGFRPSGNLTIDYSGGYQEQFDLDFAGRLLDATYFYTRSHTVDAAWFGEGKVMEISGRLFVNRKDHLMNNDEKPTARPNPNRIPPFPIRVDLPTESNTSGGNFRVGLRAADQVNVSFGVDYYDVEQSASRTVSRRDNGVVLFRDIVWPDASIEDLGGWGQVVLRRGRARIGATVRFDEVDARARELSPFFLANTVGDPDQSESNLSAAVSTLLDLGAGWSLDLGIGRAVRTASVLERYSDRFPSTKFQLAAEFVGNPLLDPEESLEFNAGLRGRVGDLLIQIDAFYREIDQYITIAPDPGLPRRLPLSPPTVFRYVNGDRATFWGGEISLRHQASERIAWRASASYVRAEDETFDEPAIGIAPLHGEFGLRVTPLDDLWVDIAARFADRQDRVATSRFEQETPGYTVYDLSARYRIGERWVLSAGVENLGDKAYANHLNSPNPFNGERILEIGRAVRLGIELGF